MKPDKPEYLFNAMASQLEHYDEILTSIPNGEGGTIDVNFMELFSKYIETKIDLDNGEPHPYPELESTFYIVFPENAGLPHGGAGDKPSFLSGGPNKSSPPRVSEENARGP